MQAWTYVWAAVLAIGLAIFVGLAVVVTIGGWGDIRALFRTLREQHDEEPPRTDPGDAGDTETA